MSKSNLTSDDQMQIVGEESNHECVRLSGQMYINAMANAF